MSKLKFRFFSSSTSSTSSPSKPSKPLNLISRNITEPKRQGASQAMLRGCGLSSNDLTKPQIGIASVWFEGNPCNRHLLSLSEHVKAGVNNADLVGLRFNTIGVSDGISMGTRGMCFSLQSREIIADSVETVMKAQWYDANICIPGCDKNMPGCVIAMARVNRPAILVYGGTIKPGIVPKHPGKGAANDEGSGKGKSPIERAEDTGHKVVDIVSAFQSYGEFIAGKITEEERQEIVNYACPGSGACGGMYTANTMASAIEAMGLSLPYSSSSPAESIEKIAECKSAGSFMKILLENDITPRKIITKPALKNAIVLTMILGGSTNAVLHLIAIAKAVGVDLSLNDFEEISRKTPFLADLKPSGKYVMADLHDVGGTPAVLKMLLEKDLIDGNILTVTGKNLGENLERLPGLKADQQVIRPFNNPIKPDGHIKILYGSLAPDGSVAKITGKEGTKFKGKAKVFNSEEAMLSGLEEGKIIKGDAVIIRYEGPRGGPGMPEMLTPTSAIVGAGLEKDVALITDGRFSGGSHGFIIGHVTPEASLCGPIGLVEDGDLIEIDSDNGKIEWLVSEEIKSSRKKKWKDLANKERRRRGTLAKYARLVKSASEGCVTDEFDDE